MDDEMCSKLNFTKAVEQSTLVRELTAQKRERVVESTALLDLLRQQQSADFKAVATENESWFHSVYLTDALFARCHSLRPKRDLCLISYNSTILHGGRETKIRHHRPFGLFDAPPRSEKCGTTWTHQDSTGPTPLYSPDLSLGGFGIFALSKRKLKKGE
jgi:hypothetical protein